MPDGKSSRGGQARRELELACHGERARLQVLLGSPPGAGRLRPRLAALEASSRSSPRDASSYALAGKAWSLLGGFQRSERTLTLALQSNPNHPMALVWRAEVRLLTGRAGEAAGDLDRAVAARPRDVDARLVRSVCRFRLGDIRGAEADARRAVADAPGSSGGYCVLGLLLAQTGRAEEGVRWLDEAVRRGRGRWVRSLRALAHLRLGRWELARRDLDHALKGEPAAWMYAQRAEAANRMGFFIDALADLGRMARRLPLSPEPHVQAARIHLEQAQYARAAQRLGRAIALRPGDGALYAQRARVRLTQHRLPEAARDLRVACRLLPGERDLAFERLRVLILRGRLVAARRAILRDTRAWGDDPRKNLLFGFLETRSGRFRSAVRHFGAAAAASAERSEREEAVPAAERRGAAAVAGVGNDLAEKAGLYRATARILGQCRRSRRSECGAEGPRLLLCGLGYRHPFQVSVAVVRALSTCRLVYSNLSDSRVSEFLGLFDAEPHPIVFRRFDRQADVCVRDVFEGLRGGGSVALVTRGHPLFYGRLAERLVRRAQREGVPCRVFGSVSVADTILSAVGADVLGDAPASAPFSSSFGGAGALILDSSQAALGTAFQPELPLILYNLGHCHEGQRGPLVRALRAAYAPEHPCYLLAGSGEDEFRPLRTTLGGLDERLRTADPAVTLLLPPRSAPLRGRPPLRRRVPAPQRIGVRARERSAFRLRRPPRPPQAELKPDGAPSENAGAR